MGRAGTLQQRPQPHAAPRGVISGVAAPGMGSGWLGLGNFVANLIIARGRWTVEARPVAGPGMDEVSIHRATVRSRHAAKELMDQWARDLESGEPPVSG